MLGIRYVNALAGDKKKNFVQRRLDYCLLSNSYQEEIERADIIPSLNSDHSAIVLHFNIIKGQKYHLIGNLMQVYYIILIFVSL